MAATRDPSSEGRAGGPAPRRRLRGFLIAAALAVGGGALPGAAADPDAGLPRRLAAGSSLEATLSWGEVHRYAIDLTRGDYLAVAIDQRTIDVLPAITGPDGAALFRNSDSDWGREEAAIVAPIAGTYRIDVAAARRGAATGTYELRVETVRPATAGDAARAQALGLMSEAYNVFSPILAAAGPVSNVDLPRARALYEQALAAWRSLGDRRGEAWALFALGAVANNMDDYRGQADFMRQAAEAARAAGDEYAEASALQVLGKALDLFGEYEEAGALYDRSLAIYRATGNVAAESMLLYDLAQSHGVAGDVTRAMDESYQGLALARKLGDASLEAQMLASIARAHLGLGEMRIVIDTCRRVLDMPEADDIVKARAQGLTGMALAGLGEYAEARRSLEASQAFWEKMNWRGYQAAILNALGGLSFEEGDLEQAAGQFERAAAAASATKVVAAEANARRRRAEVLIRLGRLDEAQREIEAAGAIDAKRPDLNVRALDKAIEGRLAMARGDLAAARRHAEAGLDLSESARGRATSARARSALLASGQTVYETLVDILMAQHERNPLSGYDARALEVSEQARARSMLESMLGRRPGAAGARGADPVDEMRVLQRRLNAKAEALDGARRSGNAERIAALTHDIDEMSDAFTLLESRIRRTAGPAATVVAPAPLTASAIRTQLLDRNTVLVEYLLTDTAGYAWVVTKDRVVSHRLAARKVVEEAAAGYQAAIARPPVAASDREAALAAAAARLSGLLLPPLRDLPAGRRLLIVAPGSLQQVPFAALGIPGSTGRMLEQFEIVQAPSASIVAASRKAAAARAPAGKALAVFADPVFEAKDPRVARAPAAPAASGDQVSLLMRALRDMPEQGQRAGLARLLFSRQEAEAIAALAPPGEVKLALGFDASLTAVTHASLAEYRIVHFATHGLLDTRTPELSGLVFSLVDPAGAPQEGYLRLHEVDRLRLNADLAVLSGCETALGRSIAGEGVIGLTRGFMLAGARGVVASLWKVDDLATAEMMQRFYRGVIADRMPPPAALRRAQMEMAASERWRDPYFWAGFVVQGEWR